MLIISAVFLWIITLQQVSCQEGYYNVYDDHAEYGNTPSKPCNVGRPGDPDLSDDDLLRSYGFNEDYWSYIGVQKTVGSTYHQTAYHFEEYANLTIESSRAFPTGVPWEFSFEATFRLPVFLPQNKWNLFELSSFYSNSEMSLAINPYFRSIELALPKYDGSLQQIVFEEIEIFDRSWHKVMFGVGQDQVRLWIDCLPVHNERGSVVTPLDVRGPIDSREGAFTIAQDCQTRKSIPIDLQWMIFSCDKNKPQYTRCEELIPINPPKNVNSLNTPNLPQYESTTPPKLPIDLSFMTSTPQSESTESSLIPEGLRSKDLSVCPEQCPMGPPGPPGLPGISGQKGEPGTEVNSPVLIGPKALPGQKGEPGSVGPAGPPGPSGFIANDNRTLVLPGPKGPPGLQGLPGLPGQKGEEGLPGINGQPGPRGTKGDSGPKGETGSRGLKGEAGREGISGIDGRDGIPGPRGQSGPPGLPGPPGRPGMSFAAPEPLLGSMEPEQIRAICMEVVKDYVAEITKSLVGPQGIPGVPGRSIVGPRGPQGIQGDKGMRGEAGERGFSGLPGVPGNRGSIGIPGEPGQKGEQGNNGVGLPGPVGAEGPRGAPGPSVTGPIGKPGQTGPKGHNGYDGLPGSPGRPGQCPDCSSHLAALSYPALYQQQQRNSKGPQNTKGPQED